MRVQKMHPVIGLEILDLDLSNPLSDESFKQIRAGLNEYSLILIRNQNLTEEQHVNFSKRFGNLMTHVLTQYLTTPYPELYVLSNKSINGKPIGNHKEGWNWHSDWSYYEVPCLGSVLYAREVPPEGGDTLFSSMCAAYEALDDNFKKRLLGLEAVHSYVGYYRKAFKDRAPLSDAQMARTPDVTHPIVRTHPETGRKSLYVGEDIVSHIIGLEKAESADLLARLNAHAVSEEFVYRHNWREGDLIIWDNRCTMHCATPYHDQKYFRVMHRATIEGVDRPR